MRKVELYERIRRDHAERGWSVRRLAREHRVHRREVRQALLNAQPPASAPLNRSRPVLGPLTPVIDAILEQDREAPRKQRHTAHRIWERLVSEHGAQIAEPAGRRYVGRRKRGAGWGGGGVGPQGPRARGGAGGGSGEASGGLP